MPNGNLNSFLTSLSPGKQTAVIGAILGVVLLALVAVVVGTYAIESSSDSTAAEPATSAATMTTAQPTTTAAQAASRLTCGSARTVTVTDEAATVIDTWKIVRESDTATTACNRVSVYRGEQQVSTLELAQGVSAVDGDEGLWIYEDGRTAVAADQSVGNENLGQVWLIASTTDERTVSANLADGQLAARQ
jgi:hypothetical protein